MEEEHDELNKENFKLNKLANEKREICEEFLVGTSMWKLYENAGKKRF
jgi:hypothetical protein